MRYSTLVEEERLWKNGYQLVAGIDEVGRGPLAGPVVAAAVVLLPKPGLGRVPNIRDSKQLSAKQREEFYKILLDHPALEWGIGRVYPAVIDRINIYQATKLAMKRAFLNLQTKIQKNQYITKSCYSKKTLYIDFLIIDGNMKLKTEIPQKSIIKADEKVFSCAAASIIAKVKRDRLMKRYHQRYALYGFDKHKGYGTKLHLVALKKHGPSSIHRLSFAPVLA